MDIFELFTLIENDLEEYVRIYLSQPKLTIEEREKLYEDILKGNNDAKEQLLLSNLRLPILMAKKYSKDIDEFKEYLHAGNCALFEALDAFSYKKGSCFTRYANMLIKKSFVSVIADR